MIPFKNVRLIVIVFIGTLVLCGSVDAQTWPYPIPCRINSDVSQNVMFITLGNVITPLAQGMFYPQKDQIILNNGQIFNDYYKNSLNLQYYNPINKAFYPLPPCGWISWPAYKYYINADTVVYVMNEDTIKTAVDFFSRTMQPFGMQTFQVDDGWEKSYDYFEVPSPTNFPEGMDSIARYIKAHNLKPGLWLVPQGCASGDDAERYDAFLRENDSTYFHTLLGFYTVDPTSPQANAFLVHEMDTLRSWGYNYFKIDAQPYVDYLYDSLTAYMHNPDQNHTDYYRQSVTDIRQGCSDSSYITGSWNPISFGTTGLGAPLTAVDILNACRLTGDIGDSWKFSIEVYDSIEENLYLNNVAFYTDFDVFFVGDTTNFEQAQTWATMIGITGVPMMNGDNPWTLTDERLELLRRIYPTVNIYPLDLFRNPGKRKHIWDLKINQIGRQYDVVAVIKTDEYEPSDLIIYWKQMGWDTSDSYHVYDFWNKEYLGTCSNSMVVEVPDTGCRVFSFVKVENAPKLISTSRHITQGWVDLDTLVYDTAAMTFSGVSPVVGNDPYELRFAVPLNYQNSFVAMSASVDGLPFHLKQTANFITLSFTSPQSAKVRWSILFKNGPLSVEQHSGNSDGYGLSQNYPNPFSPVTTIDFQIHASAHVTLDIFNAIGTRMATLVDANKPQGSYTIPWNATGLPEGVYYYRLKAGKMTETKQLLLIK